MSDDAFFEPDPHDPSRFHATRRTGGPWSHEHQHGGPPAALIAREIERTAPREGMHIGRITIEILRPIPIAALTASARVVRPGRNVELLEAALDADDGPVLAARAWRFSTAATALPGGLVSRAVPAPLPEAEDEHDFFPTAAPNGYHSAVEWRFATGSWLAHGPAVVYARMRIPLVAGEPPTALQRVVVAADSGSGVSSTLDATTHQFINTDLTVHLHRDPVGEWVGMQAVTLPEPHGIGLADTLLFDELGACGRALQTLFVRER